MNREEAIKICRALKVEADLWGEEQAEAFDMAIEALEGMCFDEWCYECKEYDTEKKCCPRFNRVIREAMKRVPHEDGTLEVKVEDATKIGRVLISDDEHRGGLYYPDEDEPKGEDLISRADAIEAVTGALDAIDHVPKWVFDKLTCAINILPSADRPRGEWIPVSEKLPREDQKCLVCHKGAIGIDEFIGHDLPYKWRIYLRDYDAWMPLPEPFCGADMRGDGK